MGIRGDLKGMIRKGYVWRIYIYIYICNVYIYICVYIYIFICIYIYIYVYIHIYYIYIYQYLCIIYIYMFTHTDRTNIFAIFASWNPWPMKMPNTAAQVAAVEVVDGRWDYWDSQRQPFLGSTSKIWGSLAQKTSILVNGCEWYIGFGFRRF